MKIVAAFEPLWFIAVKKDSTWSIYGVSVALDTYSETTRQCFDALLMTPSSDEREACDVFTQWTSIMYGVMTYFLSAAVLVSADVIPKIGKCLYVYVYIEDLSTVDLDMLLRLSQDSLDNVKETVLFSSAV